jgi:phosphoribosylanthranilate isomerase
MPRTRLKVCCIASAEEARLAVSLGADVLGLVSAMPSGPGPIADDAIAGIAHAVPPGVMTFLLTSRTEGDDIAGQARAAGVSAVQIVAHVDRAEHTRIRAGAPNLRIVQVVHVEDGGAVGLARAYAETADAILLDSGRPAAAELGGTGRVHDWEISRDIVRAVAKPVFLAGGLKPENVARAVRQVRPFGVDLCSGVRTNDRLDAARLDAFARALAQADATTV